MATKSRVKGWQVHKNRLARMKRIKDPMVKRLAEAAEIIRADIQNSITEGSVSGPLHVPSRPGEPPNADTHNLDLSIDVVINPSRLSVKIIARAHYAAALEFGHGSLLPRPFMRPGLIRNRNRVIFGAVQAVRDVVRVYKGG